MNLRSVRKLFRRSPSTFRPMAQFVWNDHLDPGRLAAQLDPLLDAGFGGVVIRPGDGLPPGRYLSESWLAAAATVARRARRRRSSVWIAEDFDDDFTRRRVDGVLHDHPEHIAHALTLHDVRVTEDSPPTYLPGDTMAAFVVSHDTSGPSASTKRREPVDVQPVVFPINTEDWPGYRFLVFRPEAIHGRLNAFKREATLAFLEQTHGAYRSAVRRYFGNTMGLAMVTGAGHAVPPAAVPWDPDLPSLFHETRGYPLIPVLPALFFDLPQYQQVRYDFWTLVAELTREGFVEPFAEWCEENRIPGACVFGGTGSVAEAVARGGSRMAAYARFEFAAHGCPAESNSDAAWEEQRLRDVVACKEAQSIKRQFHKSGVAWLGQTPGEHAAGPDGLVLAGMRNVAHGVNYAAYPAIPSSLRGDRKHAAGPILTGTDNLPDTLHAAADEHARFAWIASQGESRAEVLLIHPFSSVQAAYRPPRENGGSPFRTPLHEAIEGHFLRFSKALLDAHIDFDYADEGLLGRHASVSHRTLTVGRRHYRIVVLPPMINLCGTTLKLLQDFAMTGGLLVAVGSLPERVDGRTTETVKSFIQEYAYHIVQGIELADYQAAVDRLRQLEAETVSLERASGASVPEIFVQRRRWEDMEILLLLNQSDQAVTARLTFEAEVSGTVESWDTRTGAMQTLTEAAAGEPVTLHLDWAPYQAQLLTVPAAGEKRAEAAHGPEHERERVVPAWTGRRADPNVAVLTSCRLVDGESLGGWMSLDKLRAHVSNRIQEQGGPVPSRVQWLFEVGGGGKARYPWAVVAELSQDASVRVDDVELSTGDAESIFDPAMKRIPLPDLRPGAHLLEIWRLYADPADVQPPWILGPFVLRQPVDKPLVLDPAGEDVALGEWRRHGLPYYFGRVFYEADLDARPLAGGELVRLEMPGRHGAATVRINDDTVAQIVGPRGTCDLSEFWKEGALRLEVEIVGTPLNAFAAMGGVSEELPERYGLTTPPELVFVSTLARPADTEAAPRSEQPAAK